MASVNKVIVVGNLGRDPETRYMPDGNAITNVSLATSYEWKDKQSGEKKEETEWHRVVFRGKLAEVAGEYLKKGSQIYVEGRLRTRKWTDKDGAERYSTEVICTEMKMLGSRPSGGREHSGDDTGQTTRPAARPDPKPDPKPAAKDGSNKSRFDDLEDDIPFVFDCGSVLCEDQRLSTSKVRAKRGLEDLHQMRKAAIAI